MSQTSLIILIVLATLVVDLFLVVFVLKKAFDKKRRGDDAMKRSFGEVDWETLRRGKPVSADHKGRRFVLQYGKGQKNSPPTLTVTMPDVAWPALGVWRENAVHRFSKRIGLVEEMATGDREFDGKFYVETADTAFYKHFLGDPSRRKAVRDLFDAQEPPARKIMAGKGGVGMRISPFNVKPEAQFQLGSYQDLLARLVEGMDGRSSTVPHGADPGKSGFVVRAVACYAVAAAAVVLGVVALGVGFSHYTPLESGFILGGLKFALPLVALFWYFAYLALRGRSSSHRVFFPLIAVALIGGILLGLGGTVYTNGRWDRGGTSVNVGEIEDKYVRKNKNSRSYYLVVRSWNKPGDTYKIGVGAALYSRADAGMKLRVTTRPGYWGQEWIESFDCPGAQPEALPEALR